MKRIGVLGSGSWGTALAQMLAEHGREVTLWCRDGETAQYIQKHRRNPKYLKDFPLSENLRATHALADAVLNQELILVAVPSHGVRKVLENVRPYLEKLPAEQLPLFVTASKGIENDSLLTMAEVMEKVLPPACRERIAVLSGPSFAEEVMRKMPTAVTIAAHSEKTALAVQDVFHTPYFHTFTTTDVMGVELAGALKNVIAIAVGIADGLKLGMNARAALIARALGEIAQLGHLLGAKTMTFLGLAGMGDLILTCTGDLSRNRQVGLKLAEGKKIKQILKEMTMVAEGIKTARSAYELAIKHKVELYICEKVYEILYQDADPKKILSEMMGREPRPEFPWLREDS